MSNNYYRPGGFGGFSFFPPVIKNLLIINGIVFLIELLGQNLLVGSNSLYDLIIYYFGLWPLGHGFIVWQLITYQFLHGGFMHILFNMFALWMFGIEVEGLWGSKRFLIYYLTCGVAAGLTQLIVSPLLGGAALGPTIGASGAIFGVLIAFAMLFPDRYIYLYFFIPIKAKYLIAGFVLLQIFYVENVTDNVAHLAHLGGALAGFIYLMYLRKNNSMFGSYFKNSSKSSPKINFNMFKGNSNPFKKKEEKIQDAKYYEIKDDTEEVTQEQIDEILDKIGRSGYQNLSEKEKKILFEASKKMK